ncbi:hypothetical protein CONLIGDRAFT_695668 [Coniochaeta ligniaria NRRL 30616]|uniref:Uncharacterized protein n=1 Tax=Coniochaeta ligniaria NRRL 30616 TaxID=1408157 RepID=A0A1J7JIL9_9PEZI|nr:hypothetical protein CONLIGDRAFT_695668 [Coniochaeta ligniaria NRRL 30616]
MILIQHDLHRYPEESEASWHQRRIPNATLNTTLTHPKIHPRCPIKKDYSIVDDRAEDNAVKKKHLFNPPRYQSSLRHALAQSLHLGQYLCANPAITRGRHVLELGAGTGYLPILCAKYLGAEHVVASDGSGDVISNLPDSLFLNGLQGSDMVLLMDLKWGHALVGTGERDWNGGRKRTSLLTWTFSRPWSERFTACRPRGAFAQGLSSRCS